MKQIQTGRAATDAVLAIVVILALVDIQSVTPNARFVPSLVCWFTLALLMLSIVVELVPAAARILTPPTPRSDETSTRHAEQPADWPAVLRVITMIVTFWVLVFFFGFYVVPPVLVTLYLSLEARVSPVWAALSALIATGLTLAGMAILGVSVWKGAAPALLKGYIGGEVMPLF